MSKAQVSQLRDRLREVEATVNHDREEVRGTKKMISSLKHYDPKKENSNPDSLDSRESIFKVSYVKLTKMASLF